MNSTVTVFEGKSTIWKSKIFFFLKISVAGLLIFYLFNFVQSERILETLSNANYFLIILSLLLLIPNVYLQYFKWRMVLDQLIGEQQRKKTLKSLFLGFSAAVFTPARTGEYIGRGIAFKDKSLSKIILATFIDKIFVVFITFFAGVLSLYILMSKFPQIYILPYKAFLFIASIVFLFTAIMIFFQYKRKKSKKATIFGSVWIQKVEEKIANLKKLDQKFITKIVLVSALFFFCYLLQFVILLSAFSLRIDFINYFLAAASIMFIKSILSPISFGELGVREGAAMYFFTRIGETPSAALSASLMLFFINIIIPSLIGLVLLFIKDND